MIGKKMENLIASRYTYKYNQNGCVPKPTMFLDCTKKTKYKYFTRTKEPAARGYDKLIIHFKVSDTPIGVRSHIKNIIF